MPPDYFPQGKSLFPQWPVIDPVRAMWMFVGTMALLLVPKLLGCVAILLRRDERRRWSVPRLMGGILFETLVAGLIAPVVMLTQTIDVAAILLGRDSGWNAQRRDDGAIPARETRRLYRRHTVLGLLLGGVAWAVSLSLALWMLPVVLGLALAIPLALLTGRRRAGGLLRTPEDVEPPSVVARAAALQREWQAAVRARRGAATARAAAVGRSHGDAAAAASSAHRSDRRHAGAGAGQAGGGGHAGCCRDGTVGTELTAALATPLRCDVCRRWLLKRPQGEWNRDDGAMGFAALYPSYSARHPWHP